MSPLPTQANAHLRAMDATAELSSAPPGPLTFDPKTAVEVYSVESQIRTTRLPVTRAGRWFLTRGKHARWLFAFC